MPESTLSVEHLFTLTARTGPAATVVGGPHGTRGVTAFASGTFAGPKLRGALAEGLGADWLVARQDGSLRLDVRLVLQTEDGATILMTYSGIGVRTADGYALRIAPQFETGHEDYLWLNTLQAVGIGTPGQDSVTYEVYALL